VNRRLRGAAVVAAVAVVAALCVAGQPAAQAQTANPFADPNKFCVKHTPPPGTRNSSNPGITPNSISWVNAPTDPQVRIRLGIRTAPIDKMAAAFAEEINSCGGINGRRIKFKNVVYNGSAVDIVGTVTANCLKINEELKAFIVTDAAGPAPSPRCNAVQHKAIYMVGGPGNHNSDDLRDSKGRILSHYPPGDAIAKTFLAYGQKRSLFKGKKVLVLGVQRDSASAQDLVRDWVNPLKAQGVDVYHEVLPCVANRCPFQAAAVVSRAKARGVELIVVSNLWTSGTMGVLWRHMNEQGLKAPMVGPTTLTIHADAVMPSQFNDAGAAAARNMAELGYTAYSTDDNTIQGLLRMNYKDNAFSRMCIEVMNRRLKNNPPWSYSQPFFDDSSWSQTVQQCQFFRAIARSIWSLGNNVTTERAVAALSAATVEKATNMPTFRAKAWYSLSDSTPTKFAPMKLYVPCPGVTTPPACMMPSERPMRVRPL
jgi:ABC-type branched-subunit amino acid transport system substrate-binding protein